MLPTFQMLTGENFNSNSANAAEDARLDTSAKCFWTKHQMAFFVPGREEERNIFIDDFVAKE